MELCEDIKNTLLDFISDLKTEVFIEEVEQGELFIVEFFFERLHPERCMNHIIDYLLPWKRQVRNRDMEFFKENRHIFEGLPEDRIDYYSNKILTKVDQESIEVMWEFFDTMIELAETYKKNK